MRIINIVDNIQKVNFGIWNAAISTSSLLQERYNIQSEIWYPSQKNIPNLPIQAISLDSTKIQYLKRLIVEKKLDPQTDIIITHGCWRFPTRWGSYLKSKTFKWIYVPHGMLEPWSMQQKALKKQIYGRLFEIPSAKKADVVRAVGKPEFENLKSKFKNQLKLIPNGIETTDDQLSIPQKSLETINYLFMARLHHKKGIIPLVKAWQKSQLFNDTRYELVVVGPDDGELVQLKKLLTSNSNNIKYVGAKYGVEKSKLLQSAHYFILPSYSEGFPTSVLEAMINGCVPIISAGCNFPEVFENNLGIETSPKEIDIIQALSESLSIIPNSFFKLSQEVQHFVTKNYSYNKIAHQQVKLYEDLLFN